MWPPDGRSEQYGDLASVSWWILEEAAGVLPHTGTRPGGRGEGKGGRGAMRNIYLLCREQDISGVNWCACLFCRRYWAFWIWSCVPVMVMMRSSEPSSGSSILMDAPHSWRICLIL